MSREEEVKYVAERLTDIEVEFINKGTKKRQGLIFYTHKDFVWWYADNYELVEVIDVKQ